MADAWPRAGTAAHLQDCPVAIVGMAGVLPGAADLGQFWVNVDSGVDAITEVPADRLDPVYYDPDGAGPDRFYCRRGGFVDGVATFDPTEFGIMPMAVERAEPDQLLALSTAARAFADAGDIHRRADPARVGVIIGRGGYVGAGIRRLEQRVHTAEQLVMSVRALLPDLGDEQLAAVKADFVARLGPDRPESAIDLVPNLAASRISNRLDLKGPSHTVDAACASSLIAIDQSIDQLAAGRCDVMLAGGVHHCHDLTLWSVFTQLGAISRTERLRAFDRRADGLLIGEATVMLVLERLADAEAAGHRVYAVIRGSGVASDGRAASLMSPTVEGQVQALERAWRRAGLDPARVGLIEAHGTGTPTGDAVELETLRRVFGPADGPRAGLGSVKSMIGHAMPAAGAAGVAKAALALWHGRLPPTLHADEPSPLVAGTRFRLVQESEPWESDGPRLAGVNAFGFGGINTHLVLEEHLPSTGRRSGRLRPVPTAGTVRRPDTAPGTDPVLTVAGADQAEVAARLARLTAGPRPAGTEVLSSGSGPCRLAVIGPNPKRLELAAKVAERGRPFHGRNNVWFQPHPLAGPAAGGGRTAFVFPGLEPDFRPDLADVAERMGFDDRRIRAGSDRIELLGPAAIDSGRLLHQALARMGATPDLVAGHSVGEWTAQIATGMTPAEALGPLLDQLEPGRLQHPDVAFLALGCGVGTAAELISGIPDVVISHDNCPHQSVVCGPDRSISEVQARARSRAVLAQLLPFRSGFHTPMFEPYLEGMRELFGSLPVRTPSVPVWSATRSAPYPDDPERVRELTIEHLTRPVGWRNLVSELHRQGVRVFVEVGVGSLVGFIGDTLGDADYMAVPTHSPRRRGLEQLRHAGAALWCAGLEVDFEALDEPAPAANGPRSAAGRSVARPLTLGRPLIRDLRPLPARPSMAGTGPTPDVTVDPGSPLVAAFQATVEQAATASGQVLQLWGRRASRAPGRSAVAPPAHRTPQPDELSYPETFSLAGQPAWTDHAIFDQPPGWSDHSDRFPIVPLTAMVARFAELATELRPGLVPVAVEDVRAMKWLVVEPATTATVRAAVAGTDGRGRLLVRTAVDGHCRATVVMADRYPDGPGPEVAPVELGRPLPYPVGDIYDQRWLFHGPAYRGITAITGWGDQGIEGVVENLPAPGALLDNAGQVLGVWVALALDERRAVLPTAVERFSFHRPAPRPGERITCRVHVTAVETDGVVADLDLRGPDGLWARVEGWRTRRFDTVNRVFDVIRSAGDRTVAHVTSHGWAWARESWPDPASREMIMRRYLNAAERSHYGGRNPRAQRATLLGRVAVKDLLRHRQWQNGAGPIYPAEITVSNDASGRPSVAGAVEPGVHVSIAHSGGIGVALAAPEPVGIDIEVLGPRSGHFAERVLTGAERELVERMEGPYDDRLTTVWAVKEAAAKAAGTGLGGRPRAWEIAERDGDRYRIGDRWVGAEILVPVEEPLERESEYVVAWTLAP